MNVFSTKNEKSRRKKTPPERLEEKYKTETFEHASFIRILTIQTTTRTLITIGQASATNIAKFRHHNLLTSVSILSWRNNASRRATICRGYSEIDDLRRTKNAVIIRDARTNIARFVNI